MILSISKKVHDFSGWLFATSTVKVSVSSLYRGAKRATSAPVLSRSDADLIDPEPALDAQRRTIFERFAALPAEARFFKSVTMLNVMKY